MNLRLLMCALAVLSAHAEFDQAAINARKQELLAAQACHDWLVGAAKIAGGVVVVGYLAYLGYQQFTATPAATVPAPVSGAALVPAQVGFLRSTANWLAQATGNAIIVVCRLASVDALLHAC